MPIIYVINYYVILSPQANFYTFFLKVSIDRQFQMNEPSSHAITTTPSFFLMLMNSLIFIVTSIAAQMNVQDATLITSVFPFLGVDTKHRLQYNLLLLNLTNICSTTCFYPTWQIYDTKIRLQYDLLLPNLTNIWYKTPPTVRPASTETDKCMVCQTMMIVSLFWFFSTRKNSAPLIMPIRNPVDCIVFSLACHSLCS